MASIAQFVARMRYLCDTEDNGGVGYAQDRRLAVYPGGAADCSSIVDNALQWGGFRTGTDVAGTFWTGNMVRLLSERGWNVLTPGAQPLMLGDILVAEGHHTAVCVGAGQIAEANINSWGGTTDDDDGDQTGQETRVADYYDYPSGWTHVLRWGGSHDDSTSTQEEEDMTPEQAKQLAEIHWLLHNSLGGAITRLDQHRPVIDQQHNAILSSLAGLTKVLDGARTVWAAAAQNIGKAFEGVRLRVVAEKEDQ